MPIRDRSAAPTEKPAGREPQGFECLAFVEVALGGDVHFQPTRLRAYDASHAGRLPWSYYSWSVMIPQASMQVPH
jgi:hypothetical protein